MTKQTPLFSLLIWGCTFDGGSDSVSYAAGPDAFADAVVSFDLGDNSGFGEDKLPDVVLGPPMGAGERAGSLDVVSLGMSGEIVVELSDIVAVDGEGVDIIVFENAFMGFVETGTVAVSADGKTWAEWPCDTSSGTGCAGVAPVYANPNNDIDPTDPALAGGDVFDLADIGMDRAHFIRIRDTATNEYIGNSGGFDLDAVAVVNGETL